VSREAALVPSPIGPLSLTWEGGLTSEGGALTGLYTDAQASELATFQLVDDTDRRFDAAIQQLGEYFTGERRDFELPLRTPSTVGTPFQRRVWEALRAIPYGETISYAELATRLGQPSAVRAVGGAVGRNPWGIVVPCHRVVGSGGTLTGFAGGLARKRWLLEHEGVRVVGGKSQDDPKARLAGRQLALGIAR